MPAPESRLCARRKKTIPSISLDQIIYGLIIQAIKKVVLRRFPRRLATRDVTPTSFSLTSDLCGISECLLIHYND